MNLIIYILIVNAYIVAKLWYDWLIRTRYKRVINHMVSGAVNLLLYAGSAYFLLEPEYERYQVVCIVWISLFWKWIAFDIGYNKIFNNKWSYCGDNSWMDQKIDLIDGKDDNDCALGLFLKIVGIAIGVVGLWL